MSREIIRLDSIEKNFGGVPVLRKVGMAIAEGEILGIVGENGAGKSTLMKILAGLYQPSGGTVYLDNRPVTIPNPTAARALGISLVPQEFNLIVDLPVYSNIFLGAELGRYGLFLDTAAMRTKTRGLLEQLGVHISPDAMINALSAAEKQMVEIAKSLAFKARILIMDEPTTMLTSHEIDILFRLVRRLRAEGMTIVYISHKLREVKELCDRVVVLRDGEVALDRATDGLSTMKMAQSMVGRELGTMFPPKRIPDNDVVFEVRDMSVRGVLSGISFSLRRGEILGLAGLVGAGRTEVAETIMGIREKTTGRFFRDGVEVRIAGPRDAHRHGISYLSEDRQGSGIITGFSVTNNITLSSLRRYSTKLSGRIHKRTEARTVSKYIEAFNIKTSSPDKRLENLSGGNQQKVSLAKSVDTLPRILMVDEPTRGVDVSAKLEIYRFLHHLASEGMACLVISSELEEIVGLCGKAVVMREGSVAGVLEGDDITEQNIIYLATGAREEAAFSE